MSQPGKTDPSGAELLGLGVLIAAAVVIPMVIGLLIGGAGVVVGILIGIVAASSVVYQRFKHYW